MSLGKSSRSVNDILRTIDSSIIIDDSIGMDLHLGGIISLAYDQRPQSESEVSYGFTL
jgi:hypothetical protein